MNNKDPFDLFYRWYLPVIDSEKENSNAVILSTSGTGGRVSSRVVLLKQYDRDGFIFFTNYNSRKGRDISVNHMASLLFYWPDSARQIRIEGILEKTTEAESDSYFKSREHGKKVNAIVSRQSEAIEDMTAFQKRLKSAMEYYSKTPPERPRHWGGFRMVPDRFEFWEEGKNRFHSRQEFLYNGSDWEMRLLQP